MNYRSAGGSSENADQTKAGYVILGQKLSDSVTQVLVKRHDRWDFLAEPSLRSHFVLKQQAYHVRTRPAGLQSFKTLPNSPSSDA